LGTLLCRSGHKDEGGKLFEQATEQIRANDVWGRYVVSALDPNGLLGFK
jgi:hypothetical protein